MEEGYDTSLQPLDPSQDVTYKDGTPYLIPAPEPPLVPTTVWTTQTQKVWIPRLDTTWWVILAIALLIIFAGWIWLIVLSIRAIPSTIQNGTATVLVSCAPGQCATNVYNGEKRCPSGQNTQVAAQSGLELCSNATSCSDPTLPYAVQSDQSTDPLGVCEQDAATGLPIVCRCLGTPQCPEYVQAGWRVYTGNAYTSVQGQSTSFTQFESSSSGSTNPPLSYVDDGTRFCLASTEWLLRSTPGCAFMGESVDAAAMAICMGAPQGCTPSVGTSNPCSRGTLAYVTSDSVNFDADSVLSVPVGCVQGKPCPCGTLAIYDTSYGDIVCIDPPS